MHKFIFFVLFFISSVVCSVLVFSGQAIINSDPIVSAATSSQQNQDPVSLKAALIVNSNTNSNNTHDMILHSYSTDEGNHLTGLSYPLKPRMSMTTSLHIKIISANPTFKVIATEIALYNDSNNDNPLYLNPAADGHWFVNVSPGIYRLHANTEYTPSNDDVATFLDTVQILDTSLKTSETPVTTSHSNTSTADVQTQQKGQSVSTLGGSFKIIVQVNPVKNDEHDKMIFVTSDPSFSPLKFMQSRLLSYDSSKAGISSPYTTTFDLPKDTVKTGEKFMACLLSLQPFQTATYKEPIICKTGINSPASKPEIVIFSTRELLQSSTLVK